MSTDGFAQGARPLDRDSALPLWSQLEHELRRRMESGEFALRLGFMSPVEVLQSATIDAARLMRQEAQIGQIVPGAWADLLIVDGDPTATLDMLAAPDEGVRLIMQAGRIHRDRLGA